MDYARIRRIPKRIHDDLKIVRLASNWREILSAKRSRQAIRNIRLRNGAVLDSPEEVALDFLFQEIWIDEFYAPMGYEIGAGQTVVDIGANIGVFALYAATRAPGVKVYSYEPFPQNAAYFEANLKKSGLANVNFHAAAVAGAEGKRTLQIADRWILHSLADEGSGEGGIEVEAVSLDRVMSKIDWCDLLKLDCEGAEYEILYSSSPKSLAKIQRVVCEFNVLDKGERNGESLGAFLAENGFVVDELRTLDIKSGFICARRLERM